MGRTLLLGVFAVGMVSWAADAPADRLGPVVAARLELQRNLREDLEGALTSIVAPYRVIVTVEATMSARLRENVRSEETPGTEVNVKPMRQVELPGLPVIRQQMVGAGTPQMEYKIPGRKVTEKSSTIDAEVEKLTIRVFLDEGIPDALRDEVKRIVTALTGLDTARGDVLEFAALPPRPTGGSLNLLPPQALLGVIGVLVLLLGALLFALLASVVFGRRGAAATATGADSTVRVVAGEGAAAPDAPPAASNAPGALVSSAATAVGGPFAGLADCTADELLGVVGELDDDAAGAVLAGLGAEQPAVRRAFALLPPKRQLAVGRWLGEARVVERSELERTGTVAREKLEKVRSRVALGGAEQLAGLLLEAPEEAVTRLLEELGKRDAPLAAELRRRMPRFDDLEALEAPVLRSIATQLDPATLAVALAGATPALRDRLYQAVSARLRAMLQSEAEGLGTPPADQAAGARRRVELVMRRLHVQKPSTPPPATA